VDRINWGSLEFVSNWGAVHSSFSSLSDLLALIHRDDDKNSRAVEHGRHDQSADAASVHLLTDQIRLATDDPITR
jgi:hypothetical protein